MLKDLPLKAVYRTERNNLIEDFYIPALGVSRQYDRAVGFFSAGIISYAAQGISALIARDGRMRLIFGGELDAEDADAIRDGYDERRIREKLGLSLVRVMDGLIKLRLSGAACTTKKSDS